MSFFLGAVRGFEPRTLHILCIVVANRVKLTMTQIYNVQEHSNFSFLIKLQILIVSLSD